MSTQVAEAVSRALRENGVSELAPSDLHSWRCAYPVEYGQCDCFSELVSDILTAAAPFIRAENAS